ncbi:MAG: hypothetical protein KC656_28880, partial [Myxococcales bacterium]|nr:hypothetical protein [Myxococcales bacterium]
GEALFAGPLDGVRLLTSGQDLVFEHGPARLRVRTAHSITQLLALREVWDAERARFGTEDDVPDAMRGVTRSRTEA